jgi:hypothetical protein
MASDARQRCAREAVVSTSRTRRLAFTASLSAPSSEEEGSPGDRMQRTLDAQHQTTATDARRHAGHVAGHYTT